MDGLRIYFINLDSAVERRTRMEHMLHRCAGDIPWERWRASDQQSQWQSQQQVALRIDPLGTAGSVRSKSEWERTVKC
jgi:hypothetical protein